MSVLSQETLKTEGCCTFDTANHIDNALIAIPFSSIFGQSEIQFAENENEVAHYAIWVGNNETEFGERAKEFGKIAVEFDHPANGFIKGESQFSQSEIQFGKLKK